MRLPTMAAAAVALTLTTGVSAVASAQEPPPPGPKFQPAWHDSRTIVMGVDTPGPDGPFGPSAVRPDVTVYLVGAIDAAAPQDPGGRFPLPPEAGGGEIVVPVHDTVIARDVLAHADCFGAYVLTGPAATAAAVTTRVDPNGSGLALVSAFVSGGRSIRLDSARAVDIGLRSGLLRLDTSIGYGGTCWIERHGTYGGWPAPAYR